MDNTVAKLPAWMHGAQTAFQQAEEYLARGNFDSAAWLATQLLHADAKDHAALFLLGRVRWEQGHKEQAVALVQRAIDCVPGVANYWHGLGFYLEQLGLLNDALEAYGRCLQIDRRHQGACHGYAGLIRMTGRFEEAMAFYDRMESLRISVPALNLHRGVVLGCLGRDEESLPYFRRSLEQEPGWLTAHWEFSGPLLRLGYFKEGWQHYEHRFDAPQLMYMDCARFPGVPRWQGESLQGKTILVHREQGLGDQVMFASMLPDLLRRGANVWLDVAPPLRELFTQSFPKAVQLSVGNDDWPRRMAKQPDFEAPIGSLAKVLRNERAEFAAQPYLKVAANTRALWRQRLKSAGLTAPGQLRVGIVWAVNPAHGLWGPSRRALKKEMPLAMFAPLAARGAAGAGKTVRLISLSNIAVDAGNEGVDFDVADFSGLLTDFHETAALIQHMDLVITVDTSVAHVAAALGKETWILLPHHADWRWGNGDEKSYWYRDARLFVQPEPGRWDLVVRRVLAALRDRETNPAVSSEETVEREA